METENTIIDEERICKDCGRKMPADWLFCPCQFGGPRNIMLDENIAEMERLLEESIKCLHEKPSSHIYDAVIGASVHLLKQIRKYRNKLTGIVILQNHLKQKLLTQQRNSRFYRTRPETYPGRGS